MELGVFISFLGFVDTEAPGVVALVHLLRSGIVVVDAKGHRSVWRYSTEHECISLTQVIVFPDVSKSSFSDLKSC